MINSNSIAGSFSALAHSARVDILLTLMPVATSGLSAGELAERTKIPPSTLAHHLREMEHGRVILRQADGRKTIVKPDLAALSEIASLLTKLCCSTDFSNATEPKEES